MQQNGSTSSSFEKSGKTRFHCFWISTVLSTLIFLLFAFISMVPGMLPSDQRLLYSIVSLLLISSLLIGLWRFGTTDAPMAQRPLGPLLGVVLGTELVICIATLIKITSISTR